MLDKSELALYSHFYTVKSAHNGQVRSQTKSTVRSRWLLGATVAYEIFFMNKIKKKNPRWKGRKWNISTLSSQCTLFSWSEVHNEFY